MNLKEIQKLLNQYGEVLFRMGLYHMIDQGKEHFDDEVVAGSKKAIREKDTEIKAEGNIPVMTVQFQDGIVDCAASLSKFSITDILRFVRHYLYFEGDDKLTVRCKHCDKELFLESGIVRDGILVNGGYEDSFYECGVCHMYSLEDGSTVLCESCGAYYTPNHATDDDEIPCPYCTGIEGE